LSNNPSDCAILNWFVSIVIGGRIGVWKGSILGDDMFIDDAINVYADGSSCSRPRSGGIGIRLVIINSLGQEEVKDISPVGYVGATNNEMELKACIEGLKEAMRHPAFASFGRIAIHSDSKYVVENRNRAFYFWQRNKWRNYQGKPVDNALLWKDLLNTIKKCSTHHKRVDFYQVKGHEKNGHHRAADKLARQSAKNPFNPPVAVVKVRRKRSSKSVEPGSVPMRNQRISIRIITDQYLRLQKIYKYKYEVISKSSPYFGKIDFASSKIMLNAGHCYSIRFNDNPHNSTIVKMFKELPKK
jgi:ribonuclease HI